MFYYETTYKGYIIKIQGAGSRVIAEIFDNRVCITHFFSSTIEQAKELAIQYIESETANKTE